MWRKDCSRDQQPTVWRRKVSVQCGMELKEEMQMDVVSFEMKLSRYKVLGLDLSQDMALSGG